ncbi:hypothetical protein [Homoserinibacter sp. GY 40078]|uniref:hypothetical protein n=1 Tax=Homoserinibacter sp. GY 40078 TaxID=2603275 RepID=UPI0011CBA0D1|nr:hypothetical protein [Homoserinibacter sp. GY 40078]TXK19227.1 hypothetical protein FVQ89_04755 [Homoserinibacter sp. GY 40078]
MSAPEPGTPPALPRIPLSSLPLRWGDAPTRWWAGIWLIIGGGLAIAGANTFALWILPMGSAAHVAGWCILPCAGWRRTLAVAPSLLTMWLLLTGPRFLIVLVVPYLCWLLVRHRPAVTALTGIIVAVVAWVVGDLLGDDYSRMLPALAIVLATMTAASILARLIEQAIRRTPA